MDPTDESGVEARLTRLLQSEADQVTPSADALARIQARLTSTPERVRHNAPRKPSVRRRRWTLVAAVSIGVAAAVTAFAVTGGVHTNLTPDPAKTPVAPPPAPFTAVPETGLPSVLAVYRVGSSPEKLYREWTSVALPFSRAQALQALLRTPPVDSSLSAAPTGSGFTVASVSETDKMIHVDLSSNDTSVHPTGHQASIAEQWVQSWVYTVQDAFGDTHPVRITLNGKPTTLYGVVDTTKPISRDKQLTVSPSYGIYSPRQGATVTSPVQLTALAPPGTAGWTVYDAVTHRRVFDSTVEDHRVGESPGTYGTKLPAGRYQGVYQRERDATSDPAFRRTVDFTVSGPATTPPTTPPVTNPSTTTLDLAAIYRPASGKDSLKPEWVANPAEARPLVQSLLDTMLAGPASRGHSSAVARVASVTEQTDRIDVDLSRLNPTAPVSDRVARLRAQSLAWTVDGYFGSNKDVRVTLNGKPTAFGSAAAGEAISKAKVSVEHTADIFSPRSGATMSSPLSLIAGVESGTRSAAWFIFAADANEVLYQGAVTGITDQQLAYGFTLPLPPGSYRIELQEKRAPQDATSVVTDFTVRR